MSRICNILVSGGNSYLEKVKEKIRKGFSRHQPTLRLISTQWDNTFRTADATCSKQSCMSINPKKIQHWKLMMKMLMASTIWPEKHCMRSMTRHIRGHCWHIPTAVCRTL